MITPATRTARIPIQSSCEPLLDRERLQADVYFEFLYGYGAAPGLELGAAIHYSLLASTGGRIWGQRWERGLTLVNVGDEPAEVALNRPYCDLGGATRTRVTLAAHSADVLRVA